MTNWKTYTIVIITPFSERLWVGLDDYIKFSDSNSSGFYCINVYPYDTYRIGDRIQVDNNITRYHANGREPYSEGNDNIIRKVGSPTVPSSASTGMTIGSTIITRESGLAMARELDAYVEQSGGRNEYTAHIEVRDNQNNTIKFSLSSKRVN